MIVVAIKEISIRKVSLRATKLEFISFPTNIVSQREETFVVIFTQSVDLLEEVLDELFS